MVVMSVERDVRFYVWDKNRGEQERQLKKLLHGIMWLRANVTRGLSRRFVTDNYPSLKILANG